MELQINGRAERVPPEWQQDVLLNVLREPLGLVGAKYGCGVGQCGACTVLVDDVPVRSCLITPQAVVGKAITTVEGLSGPGQALNPVQRAWLEAQVAQCGYCQTGHIMAAVALVKRYPQPNAAQIEEAFAGHLCRCGTQDRMRAAVVQVVQR